ncbi:MAG TPA: DUF3460 family protein [Burkholderiaceae bacterium]|jgi:hypothetical protein|nr:DUF3460 family protein [Burkholderiaceae bacterium]
MKFSNQYNQYESEFTLFLKDLKAKNPHLEEKQRQGRAIWWDKEPIDLDKRKRAIDSRISQPSYVYYEFK